MFDVSWGFTITPISSTDLSHGGRPRSACLFEARNLDAQRDAGGSPHRH
jgi:hypothetical protein